ncbi:class F sortase [Streptomyces sp. NPDC057411]|uniref:class F sortase n=1 Tax=unclassified Streptomyces TaxID=2593676 RepID=UPI00362EEC2B
MSMAGARRHRRILGLAAALVGVILTAAAVFLATARADNPPIALDFGPSPTTTAASRSKPADVPPPTRQRPTPSARSAAAPAPRELSIPRLGLRAPVEQVGVAPDGQMQVPQDPDRVGWYRFSPAPGTGRGSSVIVGHVDAKGLGLGVLFGLNKVRRGDQVRVGREDGTSVTYEITARRTLGKKALATSGVYDREGAAVLTLITCAGPYLPDRGGYQNNLVITAVEVTK